MKLPHIYHIIITLVKFIFMAKTRTSFALSADALRLLVAIANQTGLSQAGVLELLIREKAKAEKIK